jgi:hypothetical protein
LDSTDRRSDTPQAPETLMVVGMEDKDGKDGPALSTEVAQKIGELLRDFYAELQQEPVPESLIRILDRLGGERRTNLDS